MNIVESTQTAADDYLDILTNLIEVSEAAAQELQDSMERLVNNLRQFKHLCPRIERFPKFRRCTMTRYISLVYEVGKNSVTIISIFDNRMNSPFR
jgi:plasmid stabilization system protein ParE